MLSTIQGFLGSYISQPVLASLASALGLVLLDFVLGALVALKTRTFKFSKLPQFMETSFIPYVGGLLILALFTNYPQIQTVFFSITAAVGVKFLADILSKIANLFSGLGIQIQSPIVLDKDAPALPDNQTVSPQTATSTTTPAADKTVPEEPAPAQTQQPA